jgi:AraC-like DNA-binding protein
VNSVLDLGELPFLRPILEEVRRERTQQALHWEDAVSDLVRRFLRELGTLISDTQSALSPAQQRQERTLRDIRMRVHSSLSHRWTVPEMAALGDMHPTWFAGIYTKQFGISPVNDLLNARLIHAEALLSHLPMTVTHIAAECGFANVEHFTRLFHKRMGCTPGQVRKQRTRERIG